MLIYKLKYIKVNDWVKINNHSLHKAFTNFL